VEADVGEPTDDMGATPLLRYEHAGGPGQQAVDLLSRIVTAIELTPMVAVASFDRDGVVRFWNLASAELYGVAAEQALGRTLDSLLQPAERADEYRNAIDRIWQTGQSSPARDWLVRTAGGRQLWIYSTMFPIYRGGELQQIFRMDVDITARKRDESALLAVGVNFHQMFEKSSDAVVLIQRDRIIDVNPAALALFDCDDKRRMLNHNLADFSPLQQADGVSSALAAPRMADEAYAAGNRRFDWRYMSCSGRLFWAEVLMTSITLDHEYLFYTVIRDITERKAAERTLYLAAQVFENSRDAIVLTDRQQVVISVNHAYSSVTGYAAADIVNQPLALHRSGIEDEAKYHQIWAEIAATGHWQGELWALRRNGERYPAWLSLTAIRDRANQVSNYMGILSDITDLKKSEAHTRHLAEHDFLTDLPNRVLLMDRLSLALTAAHRNHNMLAILFLDLDRFKHINDTLGHHIGDLLLREVAARLVKCVRAADTVSRQGGDEFVIILADIGGPDQAAHVAGTILQAITQVYVLEQHTFSVSTSIGISLYPHDGTDIDTLMKNADLAMYHAKESGRNSFQFFSHQMNTQIVERATFESELRRALEQDEFVLEFQAEIDVASGEPCGAEALIRWRHPTLGLLLPERFIDVAEDSGLMVPIGGWVLRQACQQARRWQDAGHPLVVAVNLSMAQFMQKDLVDGVRAALEETGLAPELLELELTEALIMKQGAAAQDTLQALRALGVRLTIDDFGTGYSRLGHLQDYPVQKLKIDRSFVQALDGAAVPRLAVVSAIIALARSLQMKVVAEGVETDEQLQFLRQHGCDLYQGSYARNAGHLDGLDGLLDGARAPGP
jgi:diguanylate cyclase (GGDEF)-like protein/PAS domain S-box-containing protein